MMMSSNKRMSQTWVLSSFGGQDEEKQMDGNKNDGKRFMKSTSSTSSSFPSTPTSSTSFPSTSTSSTSKKMSSASKKMSSASINAKNWHKNLSNKRFYDDDDDNNDDCVWVQRMRPKTREDLLVSKKKLMQLNDWFVKHFTHDVNDNNNESPFLLLKGPSGCGKTSCIKVLANEFNVEVLEWDVSESFRDKDPVSDGPVEDAANTMLAMSQIEKFKSFVWAANRCDNSLEYSLRDGAISAKEDETHSYRSRRLILIEEYPNAFFSMPQSLHTVLLGAFNLFRPRCVPTVFIISELANGQSAEYRLFPKSIEAQLDMTVIELNAITDAALNKMLSNVWDNKLTKDDIQEIINSSSGDVRSAINNMQIKLMHLEDCSFMFTRPAGRHKAKKRKAMIDKTFDVSGRDTRITLPHAIGKILYAKRADPGVDLLNEHGSQGVSDSQRRDKNRPDSRRLNSRRPDSRRLDSRNASDPQDAFEMPNHLFFHKRIPLIETPEKITEKVSDSSQTLNLWLHENYLHFMESIDHCSCCIDWISESDSLNLGHDWQQKPLLDSYQCSLSARGIMFNLPDHSVQDHSMPGSPSMTTTHVSKRVVTCLNQSTSNGKNKHTFRSFVKPQYYHVNRFADSLRCELRASLLSLLPMTQFASFDTLVIDILPFVSLIPHCLHRINPTISLSPKIQSLFQKMVTYSSTSFRPSFKSDEQNSYSSSNEELTHAEEDVLPSLSAIQLNNDSFENKPYLTLTSDSLNTINTMNDDYSIDDDSN